MLPGLTMANVVEEKKVVTIEYVLTDKAGKELDRSAPDKPMLYLHGAHNIVPGLEKELTGKAPGDSFEAVVSPEQGYGPKQKVKDIRMPRSAFPADAPLARGMQFITETERGNMPLWVKKVQGPTIIVTPLHPLAGVELHFSGKVVEIRDASEEEIAHGHAHGPGGHHHGEEEAGEEAASEEG